LGPLYSPKKGGLINWGGVINLQDLILERASDCGEIGVFPFCSTHPPPPPGEAVVFFFTPSEANNSHLFCLFLGGVWFCSGKKNHRLSFFSPLFFVVCGWGNRARGDGGIFFRYFYPSVGFFPGAPPGFVPPFSLGFLLFFPVFGQGLGPKKKRVLAQTHVFGVFSFFHFLPPFSLFGPHPPRHSHKNPPDQHPRIWGGSLLKVKFFFFFLFKVYNGGGVGDAPRVVVFFFWNRPPPGVYFLWGVNYGFYRGFQKMGPGGWGHTTKLLWGCFPPGRSGGWPWSGFFLWSITTTPGEGGGDPGLPRFFYRSMGGGFLVLWFFCKAPPTMGTVYVVGEKCPQPPKQKNHKPPFS